MVIEYLRMNTQKTKSELLAGISKMFFKFGNLTQGILKVSHFRVGKYVLSLSINIYFCLCFSNRRRSDVFKSRDAETINWQLFQMRQQARYKPLVRPCVLDIFQVGTLSKHGFIHPSTPWVFSRRKRPSLKVNGADKLKDETTQRI